MTYNQEKLAKFLADLQAQEPKLEFIKKNKKFLEDALKYYSVAIIPPLHERDLEDGIHSLEELNFFEANNPLKEEPVVPEGVDKESIPEWREWNRNRLQRKNRRAYFNQIANAQRVAQTSQELLAKLETLTDQDPTELSTQLSEIFDQLQQLAQDNTRLQEILNKPKQEQAIQTDGEFQDAQDWEEKVNSLKSELQAKKDELARLEPQFTMASRERGVYQQQVIDLNKEVQELKATIDSLTSVGGDNSRQIVDLNKSLQVKEDELKKLTNNSQKQIKALTILAENRKQRLEQEQEALITLAKKKIANKKEAKELLEQLQNNWEAEKQSLIQEHQQEKVAWEQKLKAKQKENSFYLAAWQKHEKAADYLKDKLNSTERTLESTQQELAETKEQIQQQEADHAEIFEAKEEELAKKQEIITVLQQRNAELQNSKLVDKDQEITRLKDWISKLEASSAQGNAWEQLQAELQQNQQQITSLQEQLSLKYPNKHYWIYALVAVVIVYLALK